MPPKFLENIVILCLERHFSKQKCYSPKIKYFGSPNFLAPPKFLGWLRHWLLVDTKSKIPLLNHQNRIETTVSTHARKRQHKRLRIASVSSNIFEAVVANKA